MFLYDVTQLGFKVHLIPEGGLCLSSDKMCPIINSQTSRCTATDLTLSSWDRRIKAQSNFICNAVKIRHESTTVKDCITIKGHTGNDHVEMREGGSVAQLLCWLLSSLDLSFLFWLRDSSFFNVRQTTGYKKWSEFVLVLNSTDWNSSRRPDHHFEADEETLLKRS